MVALNRMLLAALWLLLATSTLAAEEMTVANAPPVVVSTEPRAGQGDVTAGAAEIRVTFSRPMRDGSWSWVKLSDASFPKISGKPRFLDDHRTCVLPVSLEPGRNYAIWLNQSANANFVDQEGRAAVPYLLVFATRR